MGIASALPILMLASCAAAIPRRNEVVSPHVFVAPPTSYTSICPTFQMARATDVRARPPGVNHLADAYHAWWRWRQSAVDACVSTNPPAVATGGALMLDLTFDPDATRVTVSDHATHTSTPLTSCMNHAFASAPPPGAPLATYDGLIVSQMLLFEPVLIQVDLHIHRTNGVASASSVSGTCPQRAGGTRALDALNAAAASIAQCFEWPAHGTRHRWTVFARIQAGHLGDVHAIFDDRTGPHTLTECSRIALTQAAITGDAMVQIVAEDHQ